MCGSYFLYLSSKITAKQDAGELNKKLSQKDSELFPLKTEYNIPK